MGTLKLMLKPMFGSGLALLLCAIAGRVMFGPGGMFIGAGVGLALDLAFNWWRRRRGDPKFAEYQKALRVAQKTAPFPLWFSYCGIAFCTFAIGYVALAHSAFLIAPEPAVVWMEFTSSIYAPLAWFILGHDMFSVELPKHGFAHLVPLFQHIFAVSWTAGLLYFLAMLLCLPWLVARAAWLKYDPQSYRLKFSQIIKYVLITSILFVFLFPASIFPLFVIPISRLAERDLIVRVLYLFPAALSLFFPFLVICLVLFVALLVPKPLALWAVRKNSQPKS